MRGSPCQEKSLFSLLNLVLTRLTFMHKAAPGKMKCVKIRTKKESTPAVNTKRWDNQNLIPNYFMQNISWSNFSKSPQISMHFILTVRVALRGFGKVTSICFYSLAHRMLTNRRGQFFGNVSSQLINFSFWKKYISFVPPSFAETTFIPRNPLISNSLELWYFDTWKKIVENR